MENSVYSVNKGINVSIEFKGLKAQYIWYLGGGIVGLLILFAALYIAGVNNYICLGIILIAGTGVVTYVYKLSHKYGEYGLMKKAARKKVPSVIRSSSRKPFQL
ncbi:MAG: hypothetical protein BGO55_08775 [Sphingobacteriales bacterium 50-39]|nr:DUF4133 domain-containing protein [Sphingobacteriales bacterium]OJW59356.1 MAG: hypothetical protein BGO55_08775 [Sphingobacteriales bacterium 50-39]